MRLASRDHIYGSLQGASDRVSDNSSMVLIRDAKGTQLADPVLFPNSALHTYSEGQDVIAPRPWEVAHQLVEEALIALSFARVCPS